MTKTILITGATAGIGHETAKALARQGHRLLVHGRSPAKLEAVERSLRSIEGAGPVESVVADLARPSEVEALAVAVQRAFASIDVLINNAGVFKTPQPLNAAGHDVRFLVNTRAPWVLTQRLRPQLGAEGRVVNLSSAAQRPVDLNALAGRARLGDLEAYAQSKLALTMWSCHLGRTWGPRGPVTIAVNPGSLLGTNMVREGFGVAGKDVRIGSDILVRAALSPDFAGRSGAYFDNDAGRFAPPHPDALDAAKCEAVIDLIEGLSP